MMEPMSQDGTEPKEGSDYPSPSLYEAVLMLNSEPGLESWWATAVQLMRDYYKAFRVTLAVPADSTDLQNVPWGQRATYNVAEEDGESLVYLQRNSLEPDSGGSGRPFWEEEDPDRAAKEDERPWHKDERPNLASRHSFAGFKRETNPPPGAEVGRPSPRPILVRTKSSIPSVPSPSVAGPRQGHALNPESLRDHAARVQFQDPLPTELPVVAGRELSCRVLPVLQALDYEADPLIDGAGVNRVLERGRTVVLSREYNVASKSSVRSKSEDRCSNVDENQQPLISSTNPTVRKRVKTEHPLSKDVPLQAAAPVIQGSSPSPQPITNRGSPSTDERAGVHPAREAQPIVPGGLPPYEDFEQVPSSPWSNSPAPSPALCSDPTKNPFFAGATVDEGSFKPNSVPSEGYSSHQIEAIGLEKSSTIVHIPLIHPCLSRSALTPRVQPGGMQREMIDPFPARKPADTRAGVSKETNGEQKAPIAILSILTSVVPYPPNLIQSLKFLSPHLATSYSLAQHFTDVEFQAASILRRVWRLPSSSGPADPTSDGRQLEDLAGVDISHSSSQGRPSAAASLASASEHSTGSPGGSLIGTPAWEPSSVGLSNERWIGGGTPGAEIMDGYFQSKRRQLVGRSNNNVVPRPGEVSNQARAPAPDSSDDRRYGVGASEGAKQEQPLKEDIPTHRNTQASSLAMLPTGMASLAVTGESGAGRPVNDPGPELEPIQQGSVIGTLRGGTEFPISSAEQLGSSPKQSHQPTATSKAQNRSGHSLLHSYGADFGATFQSLPTASGAGSQKKRSTGGRHSRSTSESIPATYEMPPPSERLMRTIIDAVPVQIFTAAPQTGNITWVNSKFLTYQGHTVQEFKKDPWQSIDPEQRDDYLKVWSRSLRNGEQFSYRVRLRRFDGNYRWFYVRAAPLRDTRGITVHWFGTNMDIHEQHVAELSAARQRETEASELKYRALANSSPQIVFAATDTKGVIFANTQWTYYSGQQPDEALGLCFTDHVHPEDLAKCKLPGLPSGSDAAGLGAILGKEDPDWVRASSSPSDLSIATDPTVTQDPPGASTRLQGNTSKDDVTGPRLSGAEAESLKISTDNEGRPCYSTEIRLRSRDGNYRWHLVRCIMVDSINFGNGDASWFGTCTDINDHKVMEQRMKEAMELQTRFLSNMSHEIRTPLIGISGMVEFLYHTPLTFEQTDYCDTIWSSSAGLLDIVNDILDLSKIEAGMMSLTFDWFHMRSTIESVNDALSAQAINKGLELNYIVEDDVPMIVKGDQARIRQVLMNVLGNAVKFTAKGEVLAHCNVYRGSDISLGENEIALSLEVIDSGPGFSEKEAELMFKPFSQVDGSNTRHYGGSGLGLVISRQLVELHGGKMMSSSVPGQGSKFTFLAKFSIPDSETALTIEPTAVPDHITEVVQSPLRQPISSYLSKGFTQSPASIGITTSESQQSPAIASSASSDFSVRSIRTLQSERSSMSSVLPTTSTMEAADHAAARVKLTLPDTTSAETVTPRPSSIPLNSGPSTQRSLPDTVVRPSLYSILVVCPQPYSLLAITRHIETALPKEIPHQVTPRASVFECQKMLGGDSPVIFTHIILNLGEPDEVIAVMDQIFLSSSHGLTSLIILADAKLRNEIKQQASERGVAQSTRDKRVQFVHKPLKPSRLAELFNPEVEKNQSTDRIRRSVEQQNDRRRRVFTETEKSVGNKGYKVLLVEDNPTNQKVRSTPLLSTHPILFSLADGC